MNDLPPKYTGMVKETGEGTARFLHSVVKGEIDAREGQSSQAQRALDRVTNSDAPGETCKETAMSLASTDFLPLNTTDVYLCILDSSDIQLAWEQRYEDEMCTICCLLTS